MHCHAVQVFTALYNTDDNCLVAAPTGSGKTACAEFAVLRMIQKASQDKGAARCVYIAPLPGLAKERFADWSAKASILFLPDRPPTPVLSNVLQKPSCSCQQRHPACCVDMLYCLFYSALPMMKGSTEYKRHWSVSTQQTS